MDEYSPDEEIDYSTVNQAYYSGPEDLHKLYGYINCE